MAAGPGKAQRSNPVPSGKVAGPEGGYNAPPMRSRSPSDRGKAHRLLPVLFFFSGTAGLIYEVLWREDLALFFGRSWPATAMVVAVFMAGLALGARLAGNFADRLKSPLLAYSFLETGLGVLALLAPVILQALHPLYKSAWQSLGPGPALWAVQVGIAAASLLPPTILMGATLPVLSRFAAAGSFGKELPLLYGANTLGAAGGALAAVFLFLPLLGRSASLLAAVTLTMVVAFLAARLAGKGPLPLPSRAGKAPSSALSPEAAPAGERPAGSVLLLPALLAFSTGAATLSLEVLWTHSLALTLGSTVYAFGLMLGGFLMGLGLASLLCSRWTRKRRDPWTPVYLSFSAGGFLVLLLTPFLGWVPWASAFLVENFSADFTLFTLGRLLVVLFSMGLPALLLGLALPALLVAGSPEGGEGRGTGIIYGANALGAVAGPLLAGYFLLPGLGTRRSILLVGAFLLLAGLLAALARRDQRAIFPAGAALAGGILLALLQPAWNPILTTSGFHLYTLLDQQEGLGRSLSRRKLLYLGEGATGTVAVFDFDVDGETRRTYSMNGKFEGSTNPHDMFTQTRVAELPLAICPREPKEVFLLGLGTGVSLASALRYPVNRVDVCEISPQVAEAARKWFAPFNAGCLKDPRAHLEIEDGRKWLSLSDRKWDVVVSEPSNPWMAGVDSLFTLEAFRNMRDHTRPGGLVCQWVQAYLLDETAFLTVLRTWLQVFPDSMAFLSHLETTDLFLVGRVGGKGEWKLRASSIRERLASRKPYPFGEKYAPTSLVDLLHSFLAGPERLRTWPGPGPLHRDDRPLLRFQAPKDLYKDDASLQSWKTPGRALQPVIPFVEDLTPEEEKALAANYSFLLLRLSLESHEPEEPYLPARVVRALVRRFQDFLKTPWGERCWIAWWLLGKYYRYAPLRDDRDRAGRLAPGYPRDKAIYAFSRAAELEPDHPEPHLDLARTLERGWDGRIGGPGSDPEKALEEARKALSLAPENENALLLSGRLLFAVGKGGEAEEIVQAFLRKHPNNKKARTFLEVLRESMGRNQPRKEEK